MLKKQVIAPERSLLLELSYLLMTIVDHRYHPATAVVKLDNVPLQCPKVRIVHLGGH